MGASENCLGNCTSYFRDKSRMYRYAAILLICTTGLGPLICFDTGGSLQEQFTKYLELSSYEFSLTYSIISWPNIVLCIVGGYLVDRYFGIQIGCILFSVVMMTGHMIFSLGTLLRLFWLVLVGRFIFGIGIEMMFVCLQCYVILWFKGKEISMVSCLLISISRVGTSIVFEISNPLYTLLKDKIDKKEAVGVVFFIVGTVTFVSIACSIVLKYMNPSKFKEENESDNIQSNEPDLEKNKIKLRDIVHFPLSFWIIILIYTACMSATTTLIPFSQAYFMTNFDLTAESANTVTSFFSILGAVVAPLFGIVTDKFGRTVFILQISMLNLLLSHILLTFTTVSPYLGMFFLGVGFSIFSTCFSPLLSFVIPEHQLATAFGMNLAVSNIAYAGNLVIGGKLIDNFGFLALGLYMLSWGIFGLIAAILLWIQDKRISGILNMTPSQRKLFQEKKLDMNKSLQCLHV